MGLHRSICNRRYRHRNLPSIRSTNFHTSLPRASYEINDNSWSQIETRVPKFKQQHSHRSDSRPKRGWGEHRLNFGKSELELEGNIAQPGVIGFEEADQTLIDYGTEIEALASPNYPKRESTITDSERHIFNRIFTDMLSRNQSTSLPDADSDDFDTEKMIRTNKESARNKLDNIMGHSLNASRDRHLTKEQRKNAINRYPPALRAAAARAIGLNLQKSVPETKTTELGFDAQEQLRQPERERVENLLRNAETDFELWEVLEKEVFPLIAKMGLAETKESRDQQRRGVHDSSIPPIVYEEDITSDSDVESEISPLELYGPLYPSHLLLGLRLLDRGFSRPSSLSRSILPRIKSFGLLSHVLGASTPLYNELLRISWLRYDDFRTCVDLLNEMENEGLEFDKETHEIVIDILRIRAVVWKGPGWNKVAMWGLPNFKKASDLERWEPKIAKAVNEKSMTGEM